MSRIRKLTLVIIFTIISACTPLTHENTSEYRNQVLKTAQEKQFIRQSIPTHFFTLTVFSHVTQADNNDLLIVYLEGDGHSRDSEYALSKDPTPHQPLALQLALADPRMNIIYIARPGQYTPRSQDPHCNSKYWSTHRFSQEVIDSTNEVINQFKNKNKKIQLIGFSGGGGLAILVAAHRKDIHSIITIAGDLDHVAMTAYHKTLPLTGSLNPVAFSYCLSQIPQLHLVGKKDRIVPPSIAKGFLKASENGKLVKMRLINASHHKGWLEQWPTLIREIPVYLTQNEASNS